jgi:hypothetical protein
MNSQGQHRRTDSEDDCIDRREWRCRFVVFGHTDTRPDLPEDNEVVVAAAPWVGVGAQRDREHIGESCQAVHNAHKAVAAEDEDGQKGECATSDGEQVHMGVRDRPGAGKINERLRGSVPRVARAPGNADLE